MHYPAQQRTNYSELLKKGAHSSWRHLQVDKQSSAHDSGNNPVLVFWKSFLRVCVSVLLCMSFVSSGWGEREHSFRVEWHCLEDAHSLLANQADRLHTHTRMPARYTAEGPVMTLNDGSLLCWLRDCQIRVREEKHKHTRWAGGKETKSLF